MSRIILCLLISSPLAMANWRRNLKILRLQRGWSQQHVADQLGISYSTYGKVENGHIGLDIEKALKLSDLYQLSLDQIFRHAEGQKPLPADNAASEEAMKLYLEINPRKGPGDLPNFLNRLQEMVHEYNRVARKEEEQ